MKGPVPNTTGTADGVTMAVGWTAAAGVDASVVCAGATAGVLAASVTAGVVTEGTTTAVAAAAVTADVTPVSPDWHALKAGRLHRMNSSIIHCRDNK